MALPSLARLALCFALGALLGTALDAIHAYGDVLAYPHPELGREAWWVPLEFGLVGVGAGIAVHLLEPRLGPPGPWRARPLILAAELALFAGLYFVTTLVSSGAEALLLAAGLAALAAGRVLLGGVPGDWAYALAAAVLGPAGEIALSGLDLFSYLDPDVAGIPWWLPGLWANGGLLIRRVLAPVAGARRRSRLGINPASAPAASPSAGPARARARARPAPR